jgi:nanoRNase/pAp phosphatase (c-di-AMP/oligoRNAs hydrolase)
LNIIDDIDSLAQVVKRYRSERVLITFHSFGDTDAVSSAFTLSSYFEDCIVATPDTITTNARRMLKNNGYDTKVSNTFDGEAELIVLVDVNNFEGCGRFAEELGRAKSQVLIIDHHARVEFKKGSDNVLSFNDESHNSAASIVMDLMDALGIQLKEAEARMLLMGIISDSAEFKNSTPKTFSQIGRLLQIGNTDYPTVIEQMFTPPDAKSREHSTSEFFRSKTMVKKGILFIYGDVAGAANMPADNGIRIGADVSMFRSIGKNEVSISARLRPPLDERYGIHLGKIMKELSPLIGGTGGGHPCAGGAYGPKKSGSAEFMAEFVDRILDAIK